MRGNSPDAKDRSPCVPICEYSDGAYVRTYEGIAECAKSWAISTETVKYLCATGNPLYKQQSPTITFDTPADSPYTYELVRDEANGKMKPVLIIDVAKAMESIRQE